MSERIPRTPREWIEQQLVELAALRNAGTRSPSFKAWRQTTLTMIQRIFPRQPQHSDRFRRIPFSPPSTRADAKELREQYERGCAEASHYLRELEDVIGDRKWAEVESDVAAPSFEVGEAEDDFPTLDLPPSGEAPAAPKPQPTRPPRTSAPRVAPPPMPLDEARVLPVESSAPAPKRENGARRSKKSSKKNGRQGLKDMLGFMDSATAANPTAQPIVPPPAAAKPAPPPVAPPSAPPVAAKPAPPLPPPVPVTPLERPGPFDPPAPGASSATPRPPLSALRPPPGLFDTHGGSRGVPPRRRPDESAFEFLGREAVEPEPESQAPEPPRRRAPPSGRTLGEMIITPEFRARLESNSDFDSEIEPASVPAPEPEVVDVGEPVEDLEAERATEEFFRNSPVLSSSGRPLQKAQRPAPAVQFHHPTAIQLYELATVIEDFAVPQGYRQRVRGALLDLARSAEQNELGWDVVREAVPFLMEFEQLARRAMPILLEHFDRAA